MDPSLFPTWHEFSLPDFYNDDLKAIQKCNVVHKWMSLLAEAPIKILFTCGKCMTDFASTVVMTWPFLHSVYPCPLFYLDLDLSNKFQKDDDHSSS